MRPLEIEKSKVYCKKCKWLGKPEANEINRDNIYFYRCLHQDNKYTSVHDSFYDRTISRRYRLALLVNSNNDCKNFEEKK